MLLDRHAIALILNVYPDLPMLLSKEGLEMGSHYFTDQGFLNNLPCAVFMNAVTNISFVDQLSGAVLRVCKFTEYFAKLNIEGSVCYRDAF